jgi:uncharacterized membrane protein YfbV (UPF0208 family)
MATKDLAPVDREASLPTYKTIAEVLEKKTGSGWKLLGWTLARTIMIAPPMRIVGVPWKQAFAGAALSSIFISLFAVLRIYNAEYTLARAYFSDRKWTKKKISPPRGMKRIA